MNPAKSVAYTKLALEFEEQATCNDFQDKLHIELFRANPQAGL